jgi:hypothetical protein
VESLKVVAQGMKGPWILKMRGYNHIEIKTLLFKNLQLLLELRAFFIFTLIYLPWASLHYPSSFTPHTLGLLSTRV